MSVFHGNRLPVHCSKFNTDVDHCSHVMCQLDSTCDDLKCLRKQWFPNRINSFKSITGAVLKPIKLIFSSFVLNNISTFFTLQPINVINVSVSFTGHTVHTASILVVDSHSGATTGANSRKMFDKLRLQLEIV
jgi:hypothetical protein